MNEQFNAPQIIEKSDQNANNPIVNWDTYNSNFPLNPARIEETPVSQTAGEVDQAPVVETKPQETPLAPASNLVPAAAVLSHEESLHFRTRWNEIQAKFVDEPRAAVQQADTLVSDVVAQIAQTFANEHSSLENQWNQGNEVSTEDLRQALQHYRSFFNRLVV
jgi:hypothetical protein